MSLAGARQPNWSDTPTAEQEELSEKSLVSTVRDREPVPPTIAVLPPSPRFPVSIEPCRESFSGVSVSTSGASGSTDIDDANTPDSSAGGGQSFPSQSRRLSWSSGVTQTSPNETLNEELPTPIRTSEARPDEERSTESVRPRRFTTRTLTLPLPHTRRSPSRESLDYRLTHQTVGLSPTSLLDDGMVKRRTRRRSQTGPPLTGGLQCQLALNKISQRRSPPVTPASGPPAVLVTVEQRSTQPQSSSSADAKLRQKWIQVLKEMFKDLAEQSDKKGRTLDKETFLKYFPLPGVLGERLFDLFDADGSETIDFHEFFRGLAVIYNGTAEERKRFLFNMYDLDGNGYITREELSALLTHIPAAFEVLHALAEKRVVTEVGSDSELEIDHRGQRRKASSSRSRRIRDESDTKFLEEKVASIVRTVFSHHSPEAALCSSNAQPQRRVRSPKDGLTYEQFCEALEKNVEISELLNLFYDWGMPDLPVPHDTLTPNMLHEKISGFFCKRSETGGERFRFLGIPIPTIGRSTPSSSSSQVALPLSRKSTIEADASVRLSVASVTSKSFSDETVVDPSPDSLGRTRSAPSADEDKQDNTSWSSSLPQIQTASGRTSLSGTDETFEGFTSPGPSAIITQNMSYDLLLEQEASPERVPIVSGWLYKVGRRFSMKHYRFFVLRDRFLYYYARVKDQAPKKALFMQDAQVVAVCHTEGRNAYPFDILLPSGRTHRLFASTRRDRDVWVRALQQAARTAVFHDDYQLQSPRARGKFAVVHRGVNKLTRRSINTFEMLFMRLAVEQPVAVKILVKQTIGKEDRQFLRTEVAVMRLIHHSNVVQLIDVYDSSQYLYVVMEWVPKGDVGSVARELQNHQDHVCHCRCWSSYRVLQEEESDTVNNEVVITRALVCERLSLVVARGVLLGLVYLHKHNIIHRDLKPENILMVSSPDTPPISPAGSFESIERENYRSATQQMIESGVPMDQLGDELNEESCPISASSTWERFNKECIPSSNTEGITSEWKFNKPIAKSDELSKDCPCHSCQLCQEVFGLLDVKITDFGLSKILAPSGVALEQLGTLSYAAPEVILGQPYDHAVDVWSLGVVIYRLLCGQLPFTGENDDITAEMVVDGTFQFEPVEVWENIPDTAKRFISSLLKTDPSKRPLASQCLEHPWLRNRYRAVTGR